MQEIRTAIDRMESEEQRLLNERLATAKTSNRRLFIVTIAGSALIIALAAVSVLLLRHSLKEQQAAYRVVQATNEGLETRVAERTARLREANEEI